MNGDGACMREDIAHTVRHHNFVRASNSQGGVKVVAGPLNSREREKGACYDQSRARPNESRMVDLREHLWVSGSI